MFGDFTDQLINEEKVQIKDKDVNDFIDDAISKNQTQKDEIEKYYNDPNNRQNLKSDLITQELFKILKEYAVIKVTEKSTDELRENKNEKSK